MPGDAPPRRAQNRRGGPARAVDPARSVARNGQRPNISRKESQEDETCAFPASRRRRRGRPDRLHSRPDVLPAVRTRDDVQHARQLRLRPPDLSSLRPWRGRRLCGLPGRRVCRLPGRRSVRRVRRPGGDGDVQSRPGERGRHVSLLHGPRPEGLPRRRYPTHRSLSGPEPVGTRSTSGWSGDLAEREKPAPSDVSRSAFTGPTIGGSCFPSAHKLRLRTNSVCGRGAIPRCLWASTRPRWSWSLPWPAQPTPLRSRAAKRPFGAYPHGLLVVFLGIRLDIHQLDEAASPREGGAVWKGGAGWEGIGR